MEIEQRVEIHMIVLLAITHHYKRQKNTNTVGIMLGTEDGKIVKIENSFAVPFEDLEKDVWYINKNYIERFKILIQKVNKKENIIGWYRIGSTISENDLAITMFMRKNYCPNPVFVLVDFYKDFDTMFPVQCYRLAEIRHTLGIRPTYDFKNAYLKVVAEDSEEVGVEYLLHKFKKHFVNDVSKSVLELVGSLKQLDECFKTIAVYLDGVIAGDRAANNEIIYLLQKITNKMSKCKKQAKDTEEYTKNYANKNVLFGQMLQLGVGFADIKMQERTTEVKHHE